jgi:sugar-phosphatase
VPRLRCRAILFDLDGVLVDSRRCLRLVWETWAAERGLDPAPFLAVAQGRRTSDTVRMVAPHLDAAAESRALDRLEAVEARGLTAFSGAAELLAVLGETQRALVTSCDRAVAILRMTTARLPIPRVFVTAADVRRSKPDPEGYLQAARRLDAAPVDCLVVEDSPTGLAAGKDAGMRVLAVLTTTPADALSRADALLPSLAALRLEPDPAGGLIATWPARRRRPTSP